MVDSMVMEDTKQGIILNVWKEEGETPFQLLERLRKENDALADQKLSYAGRLDPMAQGVLPILVGDDANKNREAYLGMDKEYEIEILLGVETDSYDVLGIVQKVTKQTGEEEVSKNFLEKYTGSFKQPYPPYSSKPVEGKSLFQWAREGKLDEIAIPTKSVEIAQIEYAGSTLVSKSKLLNNVKRRISHVEGDFRQDDVVASWNDFLLESEEQDFQIISLKVLCSSGTYMRSLAQRIGSDLECGGLAYTITRTKVGDLI